MSRHSAFFEGVRQVDVKLAGEPAKLPIFYYDGIAQTAVFPARLAAVRKLLPDPRFAPARLALGLAAVGVTCFEYRDTDIGPYNELAISVVLKDPRLPLNPPGYALLSGLHNRQLHAWVHHLPVTTEIARVGGVDLYNYPKFVAGIEFEETAATRSCRLSEGDEPILEMTGDLIPTPDSGKSQFFSHLWMDRQPQSSEFKLNRIASGVSFRPGAARVELAARHPIAQELAGLLVSRRSIYYERLAAFEGILYGPEHISLQRIAMALELIESGDPVVR